MILSPLNKERFEQREHTHTHTRRRVGGSGIGIGIGSDRGGIGMFPRTRA
jgi:hypothetical protein